MRNLISSRGKALLLLTVIFTIAFFVNLSYLFEKWDVENQNYEIMKLENRSYKITNLEFYFLICLFCFAHLTGHYIEFWKMKDMIINDNMSMEDERYNL